jgi:hypothetical protein
MNRPYGLIDVRAVFDAVDVQNMGCNIEGKQHPIVTPTGGAHPEEFIREGPAQPIRVLREDSGDELDDGCGRFLRQPPETLQRRARDFNLPPCLAGSLFITHRGGSPNSQRRSS